MEEGHLNPNEMSLDLTDIIRNQAQQEDDVGQQLQDKMAYDQNSMRSHRTPAGVVQGYLVKTAQCLTNFQKKLFYRRYYELDIKSKQLKVFESHGSEMKDCVPCAVTHVVTCLRGVLRRDYQTFLTKAGYSNLAIKTPTEYKQPFAIFMEDGSFSLLWAASEIDYVTWVKAFTELKWSNRQMVASKLIMSPISSDTPLPEVTDSNYFIAKVYLCLLPESFIQTDLGQLETDRSNHQELEEEEEEKETQVIKESREQPVKFDDTQEVIVTDNEIKGWLLKTVQDIGMFQKQKFLPRWYILNAVNQTLTIRYDSKEGGDPQVIELRKTRISSVDCNMRRQLPENYGDYLPKQKGKLTLPVDRTEPFGITFVDGTMMLLWTRPGKDFKVWTRAFNRFQIKTKEDEKNQSSTAWLVQRSDNNFILGLYRSLINPIPLNTQIIQTLEVKSVQGWLCKTKPTEPKIDEDSPFQKTYCVLDLIKLELHLKTKDNGQIVEKLDLKDRLCAIDTDMIGRIDETRKHPIAEQRLLDGFQMPVRMSIPFALFFSDGEIILLWASTKAEFGKWKYIFDQILSQEHSENYIKYGYKSRSNNFVTTLYTSLQRTYTNSVDEEKAQDQEKKWDVIKGNLTECVQSHHNAGPQNEIFVSNYYVLDEKEKLLKIMDKESIDIAEQILLENRIVKVVKDLKLELRDDSWNISNGVISKGAFNMPSTETAPFAIHLREGGLMVFWAPTQEEKLKWIDAFQKLQIPQKSSQSGVQSWIELSEDNVFSVSLYKALTPELKVKESSPNQISNLECYAKVAVPFIEPYQESIFPKSYIRFNQKSLCLEVFNVQQQKEEEPSEEIKIVGKLRTIDTEITNELVKNYKEELNLNVGGDNEIELPTDEFQFPLALIFEEGEIFLMWLPSLELYNSWVELLTPLAAYMSVDNNFLIRSEANYLTASVYKTLKRKKELKVEQSQPQSEVEARVPANSEQLPEQEESKVGLHDSIVTEETKQQNETKESATETDLDNDIISGWFLRTHGCQIDKKGEPFLYRYFRLDPNSGVLSEHKDQQKRKKLIEYHLLRKIKWVETNISNKLRGDFQQIFATLGCKLIENFNLPDEKLLPIALHFVDGQILLLWLSARREYQKWLQCFKKFQIDASDPKNRQFIYLNVNESNLFTVSVFRSIRPLEILKKTQTSELIDHSRELTGDCMKTAQKLSMLQSDYAYKRAYCVDPASKTLKILKSAGGQVKDTYDLNLLSWVDATKTDKMRYGYRHLIKDENVPLMFDRTFTAVKDYPHPVAMSFEDGSFVLLWFSSKDEQEKISEVLSAIEESNENTSYGHQYLVRTPKNEIITTIFKSLQPQDSIVLDNRVVMGTLSRAVNKKDNMFLDYFVKLDTRTGILRFYDNPYSDVIDEYDLRFPVVMKDLEHEGWRSKVFDGFQIISHEQSRPFAIHNGGILLVFSAPDEESFKIWTDAFAKLEIAKYTPLEIWVDKDRQHSSYIELVQKLSPKISQQLDDIDVSMELSGFMCKTSQVLSQMSNKIFYKRYYEIDFVSRKLIVKQKMETPIKEKFDLNSLVSVKTDLNRELCRDYQYVFKNLLEYKIHLPKEFAYPFALYFSDGNIQLLWAPNQAAFDIWTKTLKNFTSEHQNKYQIIVKKKESILCSTLYLCLKNLAQRPTILLEPKFQSKKIEEVLDPKQLPEMWDEDKQAIQDQKLSNDAELMAAMVSSRGLIEGWLFKTSQKSGFFQTDLFYRRFYRLNLMTDELKIFDKPEGKLKSTLQLNKRVLKVDKELRNYITSQDSFKLGCPMSLPEYNCPFTIFTDKECMLLWANGENDRSMWVHAFNSILQQSDPIKVESFQVKMTKKNKIVVGLYQCLKEMEPGKNPNLRGLQIAEDDMKKRSKTLNARPQAQNLTGDQPDVAQKQTDKVEETKKSSAVDQEIQYQPNLTNVKVDNSTDNNNQSQAIESPNNPHQKKQPDLHNKVTLKQQQSSTEKQVQQIQTGRSGLPTGEHQEHDEITGPEMTVSPIHINNNYNNAFVDQNNDAANSDKNLDGQTKNPALFRKVKARGVGHKTGSGRNIQGQDLGTDHTSQPIPSRYQVDGGDNAKEDGDMKLDFQGLKLQMGNVSTSKDYSQSIAGQEQAKDNRPGRRYRALSGTGGSTAGPIKIKKMIPMKQSTQMLDANQSMQSIFSGRAPIANHQTISDANLKSDSDDDDDDIDRDPTAEIIKPSFRRQQVSQSQGKIKVKIRGRQSHRATTDAANNRYYNPMVPQTQVEFEDRVKGQIDHTFIDSLIQNAKMRPINSSTGWGSIADGLREKIKSTQVKQQQQQSHSSILTPMKAVDGKTGDINSLQAQVLKAMKPPNGPIRASNNGPIKASRVDLIPVNMDIKNKVLDAPQITDMWKGRKMMSQSCRKENHGHGTKEDGELSDWDEDSGDEATEVKKKSHRSHRSIVNVRDRTVGLSNVFSGQDLTSSHRVNSAAYQRGKNKKDHRQMSSQPFSQQVDEPKPFDLPKKIIPVPIVKPVVQNRQILKQETIDKQDAQIEEDLAEEPYQVVAPNENDCIAESYNSVWE